MSTTRHSEIIMGEARHYETPCSGGGEAFGAPALASFDITKSDAEFIVRMARMVKENGLYKVERFDGSVTWLDRADSLGEIADRRPGEQVETLEREIDGEMETLQPMRTECDTLSITDSEFFFSCYRKHCDDKITTGNVQIEEIANHFGLEFRK